MRAAKPSAMPRVATGAHRAVGVGVDLLGHGDDVLVVGQDHDLLGRHRLDRGQQVGGRRVHRLAAGHDALHAEAVEDALDAVAGGDRHDRGRDGLGDVRRHLDDVVGAGLADPALLLDLLHQVGDPDLPGRPQSTAASMAAPMSSVWMWQFQMPSPPTTTIESPMPAHTSLKAGTASSCASRKYMTS